MQPGERDEFEAIRAELEGLRAQVDAAGAGGPSWWARATARSRLAKRLTRIALVGLMLALPVIVSASHQFTDVPTSHTFHTAISRLYGARLTTGCSSTRFCPGANVTRGQMAAFLNRGLGRAAGDAGFTEDDWASLDGVDPLTDVDLLHGGAPGGTAHVLVTANVLAYTDEAGICPCELGIVIVNEDTGEESPPMFDIISGAERSPVDGTNPRYFEASTSVSHLFTVASGVTNTYSVYAQVIHTLSPSPENLAAADFSIAAVYIPFGANGAAPTIPVTTQGSNKSPRAD